MKLFRRLRVPFFVVVGAMAPVAVPLRAGEVINRILVHVNSRITQSQFDARIEQNVRENLLNAVKREELKKSVMEELVNEAQNNVTTDEDFSKASF